MTSHRIVVGLGVLLLAWSPALGANVPEKPALSPAVRDALALAARIDQLIENRWKEQDVKPSSRADDAEFLRRVYLDIAGRIPRVAEVREFLDDTSSDKRVRVVEKLLDSPLYVNHFTNYWRSLLLGQQTNNARFFEPTFNAWLNGRLRDNVGYDALVRELLTAPLVTGDGRNPRAFLNINQPSPLVFYMGNEYRPENLAASTSRLFLGIKLECAQCHDHPFAKYSRKQFWELAAFFAGIRSQGQNGFYQASEDKADVKEISIPSTEKVVQARYLDGSEPKWPQNRAGRAVLADWLANPANPYFARSLSNRLWAHFFGIGIIEPVDEPGSENPPSHPEVLDALTQEFAAHQFDLKFLIRAIVATRAYQLSSAVADSTGADPRLFAHMALKGLTPEQLFDSLAQATGYREQVQPNQRVVFLGQGTARAEFLNKFTAQEKRTEFETSILQALMLMNGKFVGDATDATNLERTETLAAVSGAPFLTTPQKIETLYLTTLSRKPRADEAARMLQYVESGGPKTNLQAALADVFWALLNSSEFILNH